MRSPILPRCGVRRGARQLGAGVPDGPVSARHRPPGLALARIRRYSPRFNLVANIKQILVQS